MRSFPIVPRVLGLVALGFVGITVPSVARAQSPSGGYGQPVLDPQKKAEAKGHFDRGADLYAQGAYEEALAEWRKAHDISGHPLIFESMANAYERLGKPREAKEALVKWREAAPPEEHAVLDRRLANLDARAKKLDEEEAAAKAAAEKNAASSGGPAGDEEEGLLGPLGIAGVVVGAVGVGLIGGGVVVGVVASGQRPEEAEVCRAGDGGSLCLGTAKEDIDSSATLALVSDIMWIGGAVATAAGGTMLILDLTGALEEEEAAEAPATDARRRAAPRAKAQLAPTAGPSGAGLSFRGTW
jgi:hypothetical protein